MKTLAIRGVFFNWLGRGCSFGIAFFLTPFLVYSLGDARYGLWSIIMGLTSYYGLADAGLRGAGTKHIAEAYAQHDKGRINRIIVTSLWIYAWLVSTVLLVAGGVAWLFPVVFETATVDDAVVRWVVILVAMNFGLRLLAQPFAATLAALARFDLENLLSVAAQLSQAVLIVAALLSGGGLLEMAWAMLAVGLVTQTARCLLARHAVGGFSLSPRFCDRRTAREQLSFGSGLLAIGGLGRIAEHSGVVIVGAVAGPAAAGYFAIAEMLTRKTERLTRGVSSVVMPVSSQLQAADRQDQLKKLLLLVPRCLFSASMLFTVIFLIMGPSFLRLWLGPKYVPMVFPILCLLTIGGSLRKTGGGAPSILIGTGRLRFLSWTRLLEVAMTVAIGLVCTSTFGAVGMGVAVLITQTVTGALHSAYVCKMIDYRIPSYLLTTLLRGSAALLPSTVTAGLLVAFFQAESLLVLLLQMSLVAVLAACGGFMVCLPHAIRRSVLEAFMPQRWSAGTTPAEAGSS